MNPFDVFSSSYTSGRRAFLSAADDCRAVVASYVHPRVSGMTGSILSTDVAWLGPRDARRCLVVTSGTHGVEGFAGTACQVSWLRTRVFERLPQGTGVLLVHALNPFGYAHLRRVDATNVDVNRNCIDHSRPMPVNAEYERLHEHLVPARWEGPARQRADAAIAAFIHTHGRRAFQAALTKGQYTHADGLFYGGTSLVESARTWWAIVQRFVARRSHVAFIDIHTGLGPRGHAETIFRGSFDAWQYQLAKDWYGESVTCSEDGSSSSAMLTGHVASVPEQVVGRSRLTAITLEFGTVALNEVFEALRLDNWFHLSGDPDVPRHLVKDRMRAAFFCDERDWKQDVLEQSALIVRRALAGLATTEVERPATASAALSSNPIN